MLGGIRWLLVCVNSHSLLIKLVSDASWHVFKDSDTAWHQLQLVILFLYDQLHTYQHTYMHTYIEREINTASVPVIMTEILSLILIPLISSAFSKPVLKCTKLFSNQIKDVNDHEVPQALPSKTTEAFQRNLRTSKRESTSNMFAHVSDQGGTLVEQSRSVLFSLDLWTRYKSGLYIFWVGPQLWGHFLVLN